MRGGILSLKTAKNYNYSRVDLRFNTKYQDDLLVFNYLQSLKNKTSYITSLILKDIRERQPELAANAAGGEVEVASNDEEDTTFGISTMPKVSERPAKSKSNETAKKLKCGLGAFIA